MKGSQDNEITFDDPDLPASAVKEMVHMLYNGDRGCGVVADPVALFRVADRFLLTHVKELCIHSIYKLLKQSGSSIVIDALVLSNTYDLSQLFRACIPVVKANLKELEALEDWSLLKDLGLVERVLDACKNKDFKSSEDETRRDVSCLNEFRETRLMGLRRAKLNEDLASIYMAVAEGNHGFVDDMVQMMNTE